MARRYAMTQNRHGWAIHIRRGLVPGQSLCRVGLKAEDFPASSTTDICRNCLRAMANGAQ